jgi:probable phosphoglycerate mutase
VTTTVFLVRHGSTDDLGRRISGRKAGVPLNEAGRREAQALPRRLKAEDLQAIYTSPLQRTRETAEALGAGVGLQPVNDEALLEIDFGDWTGAAFGSLDGDPAWKLWNDRRSEARAPNGETMGEVQARLSAWLDEACRRHPGGRVAAVTHADVIKAVLAQVLGFSMDRHMALEISPASVTALAVGDWGRKVLSVNEAVR